MKIAMSIRNKSKIRTMKEKEKTFYSLFKKWTHELLVTYSSELTASGWRNRKWMDVNLWQAWERTPCVMHSLFSCSQSFLPFFRTPTRICSVNIKGRQKGSSANALVSFTIFFSPWSPTTVKQTYIIQLVKRAFLDYVN